MAIYIFAEIKFGSSVLFLKTCPIAWTVFLQGEIYFVRAEQWTIEAVSACNNVIINLYTLS